MIFLFSSDTNTNSSEESDIFKSPGDRRKVKHDRPRKLGSTENKRRVHGSLSQGHRCDVGLVSGQLDPVQPKVLETSDGRKTESKGEDSPSPVPQTG